MILKSMKCRGTIVLLAALLAVGLPAWAQENNNKPADEKVAAVNGSNIMRSSFDSELLRIERAHLAMGRPLTCAHVSTYNKEILEALIRQELLFQESRKAGIHVDQKDVDGKIEELKKQFSTEEAYKNELGRRQVTEDMLRSRLERDLVYQKFIEKQFAEKIKVTDIDMMTYYESHLDQLKQPTQVRVSHIFVQIDPKGGKSKKQEARQKIENIQKNVKKGQDFAVLARENSDGTARTKDGDLGYIREGQLGNQFEKAVFALKPGEMSDIIETEYGFHLFKVTDRRSETILPYDSVKEQLKQMLVQEKIKQAADIYGKKLRETAKVEIFSKDDQPQLKK